MQEELLKLCREDLHIFLEMCVLTTSWNRDGDASSLVATAKILAPESSVPDLCLSNIAIQRTEFALAKKLLWSILQREPNNMLAAAMFALCLSISPKTREKGKELLEQVVARTSSEDVLEVCKIASNWIESDKIFHLDTSLLTNTKGN